MERFSKARYWLVKLWAFGLEALQRPSLLPRFIYGLLQGAHPAEYTKMLRYVPWIEAWDIRTILDVGAHVGEFASAAWVMFPNAHIYSFEPLPEPYQRLARRMKKRGRWTGFQVALGSTSSQKTMWASSYTAASSLLPMSPSHATSFPWTANAKPIEVAVVRLDDLQPRLQVTPRVLMKIDVQGYEMEVLQGAERLLNSVDVCLIETSFEELYDGMPLFNDIYTFLTQRGFVYRGAWSQFLDLTERRILQQDALFFRNTLLA